MKLVFNGVQWAEPGDALGTHIIKEATKEIILEKIGEWCIWFITVGLPVVAEFALVWGMACLMISISGKGKWLERGCKSVLLSIMLGMVKHAI